MNPFEKSNIIPIKGDISQEKAKQASERIRLEDAEKRRKEALRSLELEIEGLVERGDIAIEDVYKTLENIRERRATQIAV